MIILLAIFISQDCLAQGGGGRMDGSGSGYGGSNMMDENNNGIGDGLEDADGDGIINKEDADFDRKYINMRDADADRTANREDADYVPARDGSGNQVDAQVNSQDQMMQESINSSESREIVSEDDQAMPGQEGADRNRNQYGNMGLEERARNMAQAQLDSQTSVEKSLETVGARSGLIRFFIGPDYAILQNVENQLAQHEERLDELRAMALQARNENDKILLETQIKNMEKVGVQLQTALRRDMDSFSLFGWAFKLFN